MDNQGKQVEQVVDLGDGWYLVNGQGPLRRYNQAEAANPQVPLPPQKYLKRVYPRRDPEPESGDRAAYWMQEWIFDELEAGRVVTCEAMSPPGCGRTYHLFEYNPFDRAVVPVAYGSIRPWHECQECFELVQSYERRLRMLKLRRRGRFTRNPLYRVRRYLQAQADKWGWYESLAPHWRYNR
jgi:hypothetical protein